MMVQVTSRQSPRRQADRETRFGITSHTHTHKHINRTTPSARKQWSSDGTGTGCRHGGRTPERTGRRAPRFSTVHRHKHSANTTQPKLQRKHRALQWGGGTYVRSPEGYASWVRLQKRSRVGVITSVVCPTSQWLFTPPKGCRRAPLARATWKRGVHTRERLPSLAAILVAVNPMARELTTA